MQLFKTVKIAFQKLIYLTILLLKTVNNDFMPEA